MNQNPVSSDGEGVQSIHYWRGRLKQVEVRCEQLEAELLREQRSRQHWQKRARELAAVLEKLNGTKIAVGLVRMSATVANLAGATGAPEGAGE